MHQTPETDQKIASTTAVTRVVAILAVATLACSGCSGINTQAKNAEGVTLFSQGRYKEALYPFQEAVYLSPNHPDGYYNLGSTYHRMGSLSKNPDHYRQAEDQYNRCLDHEPNHTDCHRALAVLLAETGRRDMALRLLQRWADHAPQLAEPKIELARLQAELGHNERAKNLLHEALAVDHTNPRALTALGSLHEQEGRPDQALADYRRAYEQNRFQDGLAARIAAIESTTSPQTLPLDSTPHLRIDVPQTAATPRQPLY